MPRKQSSTQEEQRVNVALKKEEDILVYRKLKSLVGLYGMTIHDVVVPALYTAVADLEKRTLPLGKTLRLAKHLKVPQEIPAQPPNKK